MATQRRNLAAAASTDPTLKKPHQPISSATAHRQPHPDPKPTTTIHSISRHFSNLYTNHKHHLFSASLKDDHVVDSSCPALTKSKSQHHTGTKPQPIKKSHKEQPPEFIIVQKGGGGGGGGGIKKASTDLDLSGGYVEKEEVKKGRPSLSLEMGGGGGRRRSFSSPQIELADFFSCNSVKVVAVDMPPYMQIHAVGCARKVFDSLEKFTSKALAFSLKRNSMGYMDQPGTA